MNKSRLCLVPPPTTVTLMRFGDHGSRTTRNIGGHSSERDQSESAEYVRQIYDGEIRQEPHGRVYAGLGSRDTPEDICQRFQNIGKFMAHHKWTLRSGGAKGADTAFELGCDDGQGKKEIYLPYKRFNGSGSPHFTVTREARLLAKLFHPNWPALGPTGRDFMGRNCFQILSPDLVSPVSFVLCWTPKGAISGGTGQAIRMANHFRIPLFNLGSQSEAEVSEAIQSIMESL